MFGTMLKSVSSRSLDLGLKHRWYVLYVYAHGTPRTLS